MCSSHPVGHLEKGLVPNTGSIMDGQLTKSAATSCSVQGLSFPCQEEPSRTLEARLRPGWSPSDLCQPVLVLDFIGQVGSLCAWASEGEASQHRAHLGEPWSQLSGLLSLTSSVTHRQGTAFLFFHWFKKKKKIG